MSIKILYFFGLSFLGLFFFSSCGKKNTNKKLSLNYYKMSILELEQSRGEHAYRKALRYIDMALKHEYAPHYLAQRATLLFLLNKEKESVKCFEQALQLSMPADMRADILNNYACVLGKRGDTKRALVFFESLEHDKNYLTPEVALVNQARIYYDEGDLVKAQKKLTLATQYAPDYVDAYYYLGKIYVDLKNYRSAVQALDKTIQLEPRHKAAISLHEHCCGKLRYL